jgi:hypothetical protein
VHATAARCRPTRPRQETVGGDGQGRQRDRPVRAGTPAHLKDHQRRSSQVTGEPIKPVPRPPKREAKPRRGLKRSWMKRKRARRLSRGEGDPAYMAFVRTLPCAVEGCRSTLIHAHHAVHRSRGGKDDTCVPLCLFHHACWRQATGAFRDLDKLQRFAWSIQQIQRTQAAYKARAE